MVFRGCGIAVSFGGVGVFSFYFSAAPPDLPLTGTLQFSQFFPGLRPGFILGENFRSNLGPRQRCIGGSTLGVFGLDLKFFSPGTTSSNAV